MHVRGTFVHPRTRSGSDCPSRGFGCFPLGRDSQRAFLLEVAVQVSVDKVSGIAEEGKPRRRGYDLDALRQPGTAASFSRDLGASAVRLA